MSLPEWSDVRDSLTAAIRAALPLQVKKADGERIAGVGLHIDAYYGSAGLYLLPESAARKLPQEDVDCIGDWPISTDWDPSDDHSLAFSTHWRDWDDWFNNHIDDLTESEEDEKSRQMLIIACDAIRQIEGDGLFDAFPKTEDFRVIVIEHDEPEEFGVERYDLFKRTGTVRCFGEDEQEEMI